MVGHLVKSSPGGYPMDRAKLLLPWNVRSR